MKATNIKILLLLVVWAVTFYPVYPDLVTAWFASANSDNSYGILVPFISLYFVRAQIKRLAQSRIASPPLPLFLFVATLLIYLVSYAGGVVFLQRLMMVLSFNALVWSLLGNEVYSTLRFPLLFLVFMVPIPESFISILSFPLQTYATVISTKIIQSVGIPVYREGHMLYFTQTQLEVAEACSGIRSMSAMFMLSAVFMHQVQKQLSLKVVILLSSVLVAFIANILRVSGTGMLAHYFGAGVARGFLHEFSGIAMFVFGFCVMFSVYKTLSLRYGNHQK